MLLSFELDAPEAVAFTETATIVQYVQYRKAEDFGGDWRTIVCKTKTDDPSASEVRNYKGTSKMAEEAALTSFDALMELDREEYANGIEFFELDYQNKDVYQTEEYGAYSGNRRQKCVAELKFPKYDDGSTEDFNQNFWGEYSIKQGAVVYTDESQPPVFVLDEKSDNVWLEPPTYSNPEIAEAIAEYMETIRVPINYNSFDFDAGALMNGGTETDLYGYTVVQTEAVLVPDENATQRIRFLVENVVPIDLESQMQKGMLFVSYLSFQMQDSRDDPVKVGCQTTYGAPERHMARQVSADFDIASEFLDTSDYWVSSEETIFREADEVALYSTIFTDYEIIAKCAFEIQVTPQNKEQFADIWEKVWNVEIYNRVFDNMDDTSGTLVSEGAFRTFFPYPDYYEQETRDYFGNEEEEGQTVDTFLSKRFEFDAAAQYPGANEAFQGFSLEWRTSQDMTEDDYLLVKLFVDVDAGVCSADNTIVQWISLRDEFDFSD